MLVFQYITLIMTCFHPSVLTLFPRLEFCVNVFTEFGEFSDNNICHYSKRVCTCHLLC